MNKVSIDCNKRDGQHETPQATSTNKGRSARSAPVRALCVEPADYEGMRWIPRSQRNPPNLKRKTHRMRLMLMKLSQQNVPYIPRKIKPQLKARQRIQLWRSMFMKLTRNQFPIRPIIQRMSLVTISRQSLITRYTPTASHLSLAVLAQTLISLVCTTHE